MDDATRKLVDASNRRFFRQLCAHWAKFSTIKVRDIAALMQRANPNALEDVVINDNGDGIDLSAEIEMLLSAVNVGDLAVFPPGHVSADGQTTVVVTTLIPWLHIRGYDVLADGLTLPPIGTAKAKLTTMPSVEIDGDGAIPSHLLTPSKTVFSLTRSAMIEQHRHEWPDVAADIKGASENGLSKCKAGVRDWDEACALAWAKSKNKLIEASTTETLTNSMNNLVGRKHIIAE